MFKIFVSEILLSAIIGVLGSLLGVFLGWLLGRKSTKRLQIYIFSDFNESYFELPNNDNLVVQAITYSFEFLIYNPADIYKLVNNLSFEAYDKKNKLIFSEELTNLENIQNYGKAYGIPTNFKIENIKPKHGVLFKASFSLDRKELLNKDKIAVCYMSYYDEKRRKRRTKIYLDKKIKDAILDAPI